MSSKAAGWRLRSMCADDLDAVAYNDMAAYAFAWSRGIFEDCLQFGCPSWVAELDDETLAGHAVMSLAVGEAHILNLCTHPHYQRQGLGGALLDQMIDHALGEAANCMFLEVRRSNQPALALYACRGFQQAGLRKGYYPADQGREDAIVLRLDF